MKKQTTILALVVLMLGIAQCAFAAEKTQMPIPVSSTSKATPSVAASVGTISDINAQSLKLSAVDGSSSTIAIDPVTTSVWKMGKMLPLSDLKSGDKVKVRHTTKNGKDVAKSIEVL